MGIPTERFVSPVPSELLCSICFGVFEVPMLTSCGHTFCHACIAHWLRRASSCPQCRVPISKSPRREITQSNEFQESAGTTLTPVIVLRHLLESMRACCENWHRGCGYTASWADLHLHEKTCVFAKERCIACGKAMNRLELGFHQLTCVKLQMELDMEEESICVKNTATTSATMSRGVQTDTTSFLDFEIMNLGKLVGRLEREKRMTMQMNHKLYDQNKRLKQEIQEIHKEIQVRTRFNSESCSNDDSTASVQPQNHAEHSRQVQTMDVTKEDGIEINRLNQPNSLHTEQTYPPHQENLILDATNTINQTGMEQIDFPFNSDQCGPLSCRETEI